MPITINKEWTVQEEYREKIKMTYLNTAYITIHDANCRGTYYVYSLMFTHRLNRTTTLTKVDTNIIV